MASNKQRKCTVVTLTAGTGLRNWRFISDIVPVIRPVGSIALMPPDYYRYCIICHAWHRFSDRLLMKLIHVKNDISKARLAGFPSQTAISVETGRDIVSLAGLLLQSYAVAG